MSFSHCPEYLSPIAGNISTNLMFFIVTLPLFLITNLIAVPLSTIILFAEIALVAFSWIPFVGIYLGKITGWLVWLMNKIILWVNDFSFAVWDKIPANVLSTWLLYAVVIGISVWLINKNKKVLRFSLFALLAFVMVHAYGNWQIKNQQKALSPEAFAQKVKDFQIKVQNSQNEVVKKKGILQAGYAKSLGLIRDTVIKIVNEIATERNIDLVLAKGNILFSKNGVDVTDEALKRLNSRLSKVTITVK